jgi:hypothetical protein
MGSVRYELMLVKFNAFLELLDGDDDLLLLAAVELKSDFIDLYGKGE